ADHRVFGQPVAPAAGFLEAVLAAGAAEYGDGPLKVEAVSFRTALALPNDAGAIVQTVLAPEGQDQFAFSLYSLTGVDWTLHAKGIIGRAENADDAIADCITEVRRRAEKSIDPQEVYAAYAERGLDYGEAFRGIVTLSAGPGAAVAQIRLPDAAGRADAYTVHPALLDACFQAIGVVFADTIGEGTYLPVALERLTVFAQMPATVTGAATIRETGDGGRHLADMMLYGPDGRVVALIEGLESRKVSRDAVLRDNAEAMAKRTHVVAWRDQPLDETTLKDPANTLVIGESPFAQTVAASLGADIAAEIPDAASLSALGAVVLATNTCAAPSDSAPDGQALLAAALGEAAGLLHLVQMTVAADATANLSIVVITRGLAPIGEAVSRGALPAAPLAGMARSIGHEFPELALKLVDFDPAQSDDHCAVHIAQELAAQDGESEVAWCGNRRRAARFASLGAGVVTLPQGPHRLASAPGEGFDGIKAEPLTRRAPEAGEVEIEVTGMGLNYRDVLGAMGLYPGDLGLSGSECSGHVVRVGEGATFSPGDPVIAVAPGCFATHATVPKEAVFHAPEGVPLVDAAGLPIVTLTAWYGLSHLAGLKTGERVLIHSAAGGVGLMALAIARHLSAEIFATASARKHPLLRSLGVRYLSSSRDGDFAQEVLAATGGEGVDVVLNSLPVDLMEANLAALGKGGRFVEIGRRDLWTAEQVEAVRPDAAYHIVNLDDVAIRDPALLRRMLEEPLALLSKGALPPPRTTEFAASHLPEAMAFMQTARHVGKIVLRGEAPPAVHPFKVDPEGSYLITGGLGGLGLHLARFL
ncbi:MAG: polyketide synthase dehydratase domain-containing protein, partial [Pseudomonadota bacterium]